jgi:hypothetical protein
MLVALARARMKHQFNNNPFGIVSVIKNRNSKKGNLKAQTQLPVTGARKRNF